MSQQWFKFYGGEFLSDPKMLALSACERSCWLTLLCYASMSGKDGMIDHLTVEMLMAQSGVSPLDEEWEQTKNVLQKMEKLGMVTLDNVKITINNWRKRQSMALTGYERVKRYRERHEDDNTDNEIDNIRIEENRIDKNREEKKNTYGQFHKVKLTLKEYDSLKEKLGEEKRDELITELDCYKASKGKKYSSDYATILNWSRRKSKETGKSTRTEKPLSVLKF